MTWETLIVIIAHAVTAPTAVVHALLYKRDSRSALGWVGFCLVFPLVGPLIYALFGVNRVRTRAQKLVPQSFRPHFFDYERGDQVLTRKSGQPALAHVGYFISGRPPQTGNSVAVLHNGEEAYPAMLAAMD
jgi:cardiolipin synthase